MPAHGLHDRVAVLPRRKAGANADDDGCVRPLRAQISLGENCVHHRDGVQLSRLVAFRIDQHGDVPLRENLLCRVRVLGERGGNSLHRRLALHNRFRIADRTTNGRWNGQIAHHDGKAALMQPIRDTGREIPRAANPNDH
ncbi:hypothetical protein SDC9_194000 [bioreactor metagenome]|uniref:Uncharacterized protein n=1 Tax=bioreactor metagenome TaxID=1076179 RepID=A0A645IDQ0_9ZZZZ